jgi:hypothetical protein
VLIIIKLSEAYAGYTWKFGASALYGNGFARINNKYKII